MANFPENWYFGILTEPRNFPEIGASGGAFGRTLRIAITNLGYPNFRTPAIWLSGYFRVNPKFIVDDYQFAILHVLAVSSSVYLCTYRIIISACAQIGHMYTAAVKDKAPMDCDKQKWKCNGNNTGFFKKIAILLHVVTSYLIPPRP